MAVKFVDFTYLTGSERNQRAFLEEYRIARERGLTCTYEENPHTGAKLWQIHGKRGNRCGFFECNHTTQPAGGWITYMYRVD